MKDFAAKGRIVAVLGPTNTGKTHLALERMSGYGSAMIGFPLRLLARENYERLRARKGGGSVALLTGEEKIVPPRATHFICTVEAMPIDRRVDFLAIDEIQLCADPDRGHVFTDRLLRARGDIETMFMGSDSIRPLLRKLVPGVTFVERPRFSRLTYSGARKLARLPPRSAIVAFSAADVYSIAEMTRRAKGGAAVVLGALSPRARNAQVALYQSREVDYLVATDAIGMGLNMDIDHVAFAAARKFDGRAPRLLDASEIAQIAGRAGRHMNDGTFGATADLPGLAPDIVDAVENHVFPPLQRLQWRNPDLRFSSVEALLSSLEKPPDLPGLIRAREADDHLALRAILKDEDVTALAIGHDRVRLLWEVCQIPDFGKSMPEQHARLLARLYRHLVGGDGQIPEDWIGAQINRINRTDGDIETLAGRIAAIRVWTYVANRNDWLADPPHWRDLSRDIEDRLSDALHERLTQRFVDRRTAHLARRLKDGGSMTSFVEKSGAVQLDGHFVGTLKGFRFHPDQTAPGPETRTLLSAAGRALNPEIAARVDALAKDGDDLFSLEADGSLAWRGETVARLSAGADILFPAIAPINEELLDQSQKNRIQSRLGDWLNDWLRARLAPLYHALSADLAGSARGLVWQLGQGLGSVPERKLRPLIRSLSKEERKDLARLGVRTGAHFLYMPALLKPAAREARALLWANARGVPPPPMPPPRSTALPDPALWPNDFLEAIGFSVTGQMALRVDILERVAQLLRKEAETSPSFAPPALSFLGMPANRHESLLHAMGYEKSGQAGLWRRKKRKPPIAKTREITDSPFAALADFIPTPAKGGRHGRAKNRTSNR